MAENSKILLVKPGQSVAEAEAEADVKLQRQAMAANHAGLQASLSNVVRVLFMGFAMDRRLAIEVCLEHIVQLAIADGLERKQLVAWLFERYNLEEEALKKATEGRKVGLVAALQAMRAQGLKVPPNVMGQVNLLKVDLDPELKDWVDNNQQPPSQIATAENMHGLPPGAIQ